MITRNFGAPAASGRIYRANSTFVPATGNSHISIILGSWCGIPSCLRIRGYLMAAPISPRKKAWMSWPIFNLLVALDNFPVLTARR